MVDGSGMQRNQPFVSCVKELVFFIPIHIGHISNGNIGIAAGINFGILYLFVAPYLAISALAFFWYRTSKKNENKFKQSGLAG